MNFRDACGDLKVDRDVCVGERPKSKKTRSRGNYQSREELEKSVVGSDFQYEPYNMFNIYYLELL